jgi:anti-sigma B factor antagonist
MISGTHSERRGDVTVLRPIGSMDGRSARDALTSVHAEIEAGHRNVVIDLGEVEFIDSSGLGTLVRMLRAADAAARLSCTGSVVLTSG